MVRKREETDISNVEGQYNYGFSVRDENLYGTERSRPVLSAKYLESTYEYNDFNNQNIFKSGLNYVKKYYTPSKDCCETFLYKRIPAIEWIKNYNIRESLLKDIIGGITVGIIQVPQAMAYSLTAGLPAANGLYVTFFHCLIYFFLGTSKHISPGTYAIISLMILTSTNKYEGKLFPMSSDNLNSTVDMAMLNQTNPEFISNDPVEARVLISMVMSLSSGIFLLLLSVLHFGFVTKFLSDAIVGGLSVGAVFQVIISQIPVLLGIKLNPLKIPFVFIGTTIEIFKHIQYTNPTIVVISVISLIVLFVFKLINDKWSHKMPAPIPIEITTVIVATLISYYVNFEQKWNVKIVGPLPLGFPAPRMPPMNLFITLIGDSIAIAILTFALQVSFSKLFAKKHKYEISANQEFFAYGTCNIVSSFFNGYPGCVALSRCIIADGIGVKTQIVGLISSLIMLIVILALGPLLRTLPNCCLAALIVVALIKKVLDVGDFWKIFKKNRLDALAWLFTFLGVVVFDVDIGLYIGLVSTLLLIIFKTQRARSTLLGNIPGTNIYEDVHTCREAQEYKHIKIVRYEESVFYANVDNFKYKVQKLVDIKPREIMAQIDKECDNEYKKIEKLASKQKRLIKKQQDASHLDIEGLILDQYGLVDLKENKLIVKERIRNKYLNDINIKHIILDCSCINHCDSQGIQAVLWLFENYREINIQLHLSYCKLAVTSSFKRSGLDEKFDFESIFSTTFEAVLYIFRKDYPGTALVIDDEKERREESDPEDDVKNPQSYYKPYNSNSDQFFATQI